MDQFKQLLAMLGRGTARAVDAEVHRPRTFGEAFLLTPDQIAGQRILGGLRAVGNALGTALITYAQTKAERSTPPAAHTPPRTPWWKRSAA